MNVAQQLAGGRKNDDGFAGLYVQARSNPLERQLELRYKKKIFSLCDLSALW